MNTPKIILTFVIAVTSFQIAIAQNNKPKKGGLFNSILKQVSDKLNNNKDSLSSTDIISGLKEALNVGTQKSTGKLSMVDGFLKDAAVKILLPPEAQKVEKTVRTLGGGKLVDNAILTINRAAEDAAKKASPIFLSAIKKMTINDALNILKGSDTAATAYLKKTTGIELAAAFRPVIDSSLIKVNATKYWKDVFETYNKFSFNKVNPDLGAYVTERAINGIFYYVAQEEKNIRKDPLAYANDILKKVFGKK